MVWCIKIPLSKQGKVGVLTEGAYAYLILVNGNPLQDLNLMGDPDKNFMLIIKDGMIYKNTINQ
jgi:imidazolonepropionase-like amidohydrolase